MRAQFPEPPGAAERKPAGKTHKRHKTGMIPFAARIFIRLVISCLLLSLLPAAYAQSGRQGGQGISGFLSRTGLSFEEYLEVMDNYEQDDIYPHYLSKNASRYMLYQMNNPLMPEEQVISYVNVREDMQIYSNIVEVPEPDNINLLVNNSYKLPQDWEPDDLTSISGRYQLREEAAQQFILMRDAMRKEGLSLHIVSAFRTYETQENLHKNALINNRGNEDAGLGVARAGHSEHQTGLAVDILQHSHTGRLANAKFEETEQFEWLLENAHMYGFILRYPEIFTETHGYMYEPWHWRYVGADIATAMYNEGIAVYEEFYGKYIYSDVLSKIETYLEIKALNEYRAEKEAKLAVIREQERLRQEAELAAREEAERIAREYAQAQAEAKAQADNTEQIIIPAPDLVSDEQHLSQPDASGDNNLTITNILLYSGILSVALLGGGAAIMLFAKKRFSYVPIRERLQGGLNKKEEPHIQNEEETAVSLKPRAVAD